MNEWLKVNSHPGSCRDLEGHDHWLHPDGRDFVSPKGVRPNEVAQVSDEVRVTSETGGSKGQKQARLGSLDPKALLEVAKVAGFGEKKYSRLNYMNGYDWSLCFDALQRHILAFWDGEDVDPESGLPHTAHAAWHCLALLAFMQRGLGTDDRYKP